MDVKVRRPLHNIKVNQQSANAAVAIEEGMDGFELGMSQTTPHEKRTLSRAS
jgi:hypothetical protein